MLRERQIPAHTPLPQGGRYKCGFELRSGCV